MTPTPALRDGAAYDPAADSWRPIAPSPVPIRTASTALLGQTLYVLTPASDARPGSHFLAYDLQADTWRRLRAPDRSAYSIAAVGGEILASRQYVDPGPDDWAWDPATGTWQALPAAPTQPWDLRQFVDLDGTAVLVGQGRLKQYRDGGYLAAYAYDRKTRTWSLLTSPAKEPRPGVTGSPWYAVDRQAVMAPPAGDRFGKGSRIGGFLDADGVWSPLPPRPRELAAGSRYASRRPDLWGWAQAGGGGYVVAGRYALHVQSRTWQRLPALAQLENLGGAPAVAWAGDRLFVWGGQKSPKAPTAQGWSWCPVPAAAAPPTPVAMSPAKEGSGGPRQLPDARFEHVPEDDTAVAADPAGQRNPNPGAPLTSEPDKFVSSAETLRNDPTPPKYGPR